MKTVTVQEICSILEAFAPLSLQESYDNAGLIVGSRQRIVSGILLCTDVTEAVMDEAISTDCNLIVAHHPLIFKGLTKITGNDYIQRTVIKAIKHDIAIYAAHTNFDSVMQGVNRKICDRIGLSECAILSPAQNQLLKLVVFVPVAVADRVRQALFDAGAGKIGNYGSCSFNGDGTGTFLAGEAARPFAGNIGEMHHEPEIRIETIVPRHLQNSVQHAMMQAHPYEEPAFDWIPLTNTWSQTGFGMIGTLPSPEDEQTFLQRLKSAFHVFCIRHSPLLGKPLQRVAVCGGAGAFLLGDALRAHADIFVSADFKYHDFFGTEDHIVIADIGHYESEQFTKEIFLEEIRKKLPTFAVRFPTCKTNPVNYV